MRTTDSEGTAVPESDTVRDASPFSPPPPVDETDAPTDSGEGEHTLDGPMPESLGGTPLADQVQRTDVALANWRTESVRRREIWDEEQAAIRATLAEARRRRLWKGGVAAGLTAAVVAIVTVAVWPAPAPVEAAPVVVVAPPVVRPVIEAVVTPPVAPPPAPAVEVVAAAPAVASSAPAPSLVAGAAPSDARVWTDLRYVWVSFVHPRPGALTLRWLDGAGKPALDPMGCGRAECTAGRSISRITGALAEGAAPGTWTVQVCSDGVCAPLGTFQASPGGIGAL